jgi:hypothetical protein
MMAKARSGSWEGALDTQEHQCRMCWRRAANKKVKGRLKK